MKGKKSEMETGLDGLDLVPQQQQHSGAPRDWRGDIHDLLGLAPGRC